jgi:hypothetical protein
MILVKIAKKSQSIKNIIKINSLTQLNQLIIVQSTKSKLPAAKSNYEPGYGDNSFEIINQGHEKICILNSPAQLP